MLDQFSETNLATSMAVYLAGQLLTAGYLVYWHLADAVQTPDGWYYGWRANFNTYKVDSQVAARLAAAKGLMAIRPKATADPLFPVRHTLDGSVPNQDEVQVPCLFVSVDVERPGDFSGLGDRMRERFRDLTVYGYVRDAAEQSVMTTALVRWFDDSLALAVQDYDAGTLSEFGDVECQMPLADNAIVGLTPEATRYEVILNARLRYEA